MTTWFRLEHNGNIHYLNKDRISAVEILPTVPSGVSEAQPWYAVHFFGDNAHPITKLVFGERASAEEVVARFLGADTIC
jgi:hypothetical protein